MKHALALLALLLAASVARPSIAAEAGNPAPPALEALGHWSHFIAGSSHKQVLRDSSSGNRHRDGSGGADDAGLLPTLPQIIRAEIWTAAHAHQRQLTLTPDAPRGAYRARAPPVR